MAHVSGTFVRFAGRRSLFSDVTVWSECGGRSSVGQFLNMRTAIVPVYL